MAKAPYTPNAVDTDAETTPTSAGKGRPTPTRREREQANRRPLVASGKEAQKAQRARAAEIRDRQRAGLAAGEEKYLPVRDKGPQRRWVRDYVDARFSVGEALIPAMLVIVVLSFVPNVTVQSISLLVIWGFFVFTILDSFLLGRRVAKRVTERFGSAEKGVRLYAAMRALQMKPMRLPKPQVKRGEFPA